MPAFPVLIDGQWRPANGSDVFRPVNPVTTNQIEQDYPISSWEDCDAALDAAALAFDALQDAGPEPLARFLDDYAARIEAHKDSIAERAHAETGLPAAPRLAEVELPRTTGQLRQAAAAAREGSWAMPTIDRQAGIRSCLEAIGPVAVFGPNNFPLAFNSVSGGDFAAAIASGNPVIAKANTSHPGTTRMLAELAFDAVRDADLPPATVQLLYRTSHDSGERLVGDARLGATGYTGSRSAGLVLKAAADRAGKPIYLVLWSVNPAVIRPGALLAGGAAIADEFATSCLMGTGQFCTNPGLVVLLASPATEEFITAVSERFSAAPAGTLLSEGVLNSLEHSLETLRHAGAKTVVEAAGGGGQGFSRENTLLRVSGEKFLTDPEKFQTEAFGNCSLLVVAADQDEAFQVLDRLEGNLTGCVYSSTEGADDAAYDVLAPRLARRGGRLLNDKMPTGVAVSPAMNHGGPYPATGHPGFTAVGIPPALRRFAALRCYDNVRPHRLPPVLQDENPMDAWRLVDGLWTREPCAGA